MSSVQKLNSLSPQDTTLVIILGASEWPSASQDFGPLEGCLEAAKKMKKYFLESFRIPENNLCWLFDTPLSHRDIEKRIDEFLKKKRDVPAQNIVLYYTGHGKPTRDGKSIYLPIRDTDGDIPEISSLKLETLATKLKKKAPHLRRFYIIDCCFAFKAAHELQGDGNDLSNMLIKDSLEDIENDLLEDIEGGYTGIFAAGQAQYAVVLPDHTNTFFTEALLQALLEENFYNSDYLSLREVETLTGKRFKALKKQHPSFFGRGNIQPPNIQICSGTIDTVPLFPNLYVERNRLAEEERRRQAEVDERAHMVEKMGYRPSSSPVTTIVNYQNISDREEEASSPARAAVTSMKSGIDATENKSVYSHSETAAKKTSKQQKKLLFGILYGLWIFAGITSGIALSIGGKGGLIDGVSYNGVPLGIIVICGAVWFIIFFLFLVIGSKLEIFGNDGGGGVDPLWRQPLV